METPTSNPGSKRSRSIWPMFAGALLLFVLFGGAVKWVVSSTDRAAFDEEALRAKQRMEILAKVTDENNALTTTYAWADRAKGTVRIPVDRAVELAIAKLAAVPPHPAYAVDPAVPLGSAVKPGGLAVPPPTPPPFGAPAPVHVAPLPAADPNAPVPVEPGP